jgi:hypothetical protein
VLPYLWFILIGKNNRNKNEKLLKDYIKAEDVSFNIKEQWNNNFIGIDESKNILMFIKLINQETSSLKIDLTQLKSCQINIKTKDFKKEKKIETELQSLDLELAFLFKSEIITLHFYSTNDEFSEDFELKRVEKWQTLIEQSRLKSILHKKVA